MNTKIVAALAVFCFIAVLFAPSADAEGGPVGDYVSQLDANGQKVYTDVAERFDTELSGGQPAESLSFMIYLPDPVLFSTEEEAVAYGMEMAHSALAAIYYTDAEAIWLWDLPVSSPEVTVECGAVNLTFPDSGRAPGRYTMPVSVSFTVTVPSGFSDTDPGRNEVMDAVNELREAADLKASGTVGDVVKAVARSLSGIRDHTDEEGTVSNAYDALVTGESSSAGIAMAFTYLCERNQVAAATVKGTVVTDSEGATATGYWNVVWDAEASRWYGSDSTIYNGSDETPLLAGMSSLVLLPSMDVKRGFGSTHVTELDLSSPNSLESVAIPAEGYDWPDDRTFIEKYGTHVMATIIVAVIVGVILYAMRNGDL